MKKQYLILFFILALPTAADGSDKSLLNRSNALTFAGVASLAAYVSTKQPDASDCALVIGSATLLLACHRAQGIIATLTQTNRMLESRLTNAHSMIAIHDKQRGEDNVRAFDLRQENTSLRDVLEKVHTRVKTALGLQKVSKES